MESNINVNVGDTIRYDRIGYCWKNRMMRMDDTHVGVWVFIKERKAREDENRRIVMEWNIDIEMSWVF